MREETVVCVPDISEQVSREGLVIIDFLLPNGLYIQLNVDFHKPLDLLKQVLWESAKTFPLFEKLKGKDNYLFEYLNRNGEKEEVNDETLRLSEIRPMGKFLRLHERKEDEQNQTIDRKISQLLGSKIVMEMHAVPRQEVDDFRKRMTHFALSKVPVQTNLQTSFEIRHPLQLRCSTKIPENVAKRLTPTGHLMLLVKVKDTTGTSVKYTLKHHVEDPPEFVIDAAIRKHYNQSMRKSYDHVLKVIGKEDYLYGKTPLCQFKYVYDCLQCNKVSEFWLVHKKEVVALDVAPRQRALPIPPKSRNNSSRHKDICIWEIDDKFKLEIMSIQNIEITSADIKDNIDKVKLVVGLYHGSEVLGDVKQTQELTVSNGNCNIDKTLSQLMFDLAVKDIQTASRLCFTLHGKMKGTKGQNAIAWINIPVFDFRSRLLVGEHKFIMWPVTTEIQLDETGCFSLGTVALNPHGTITLTVHFSDYGRRPPFIYPDQSMITECAAQNMEEPGSLGSPDWHPDEAKKDKLDEILSRHQYASEDLHVQDKENIWNMRYECRDNRPGALPLVLKSVNWQNYIDVAKMQVLLTTWRQIDLDQALELLDFNFPDRTVRKYAVDYLQDLSDELISLYLLQLVQALKYEMYLYCPLAEFLVERAVLNPHTGHQLFWHLKSELHNPIVMVRFALLLESYLKACPEHLAVLYKQHEALHKLHTASMIVKAEKKVTDKFKDKVRANMHTVLNQQTFQERFSGIFSPLSPLYKLGKLNIEDCKFMDSKKRPLYLVWSNDDEDGNEVHIIYKNGDDLRQDMLTLQMLHVMDNIWQSEDLDLRMNAYGCVATGYEQGMIEVVRNAETIANIQKGRGALDKKVLYDWLKEKNKTEVQLDNAIEEFILSCAGYTVATYVLGIGDRHNDNIMLKENGQLFHIDFGHFLGNFKKKYGVKRERVPVVFTSHFAYAITKGETNKENYKRFEKYCEQAYLALRNKGPLLLRLFMMMLSSGIPQLTSISDLDYLKETLALNLTDDEAVRQLRNKLTESLNSYSILLNWKVHNMVHK